MVERLEPQVTDSWYKCYGESWKGAIIDEAFRHPAKFSRALIRAIYDHAVEEGWLKPGDKVLDPFGGVALGALDACRHGLTWIGMELEPAFIELGIQNIQLWDSQFKGVIPGWGTAWLYQGDSRYLVALLSRANIEGARTCVTSPPYSDSVKGMGGPVDFSKTERDGDVSHQRHGMADHGFTYGHAPGQLSQLPEGDSPRSLPSPPSAASQVATSSTEIDFDEQFDEQWLTYRAQGGSMNYDAFVEYHWRHPFEHDGADEQPQCPEEEMDFNVSISSPPFGAGETRDRSPVQAGEVADCITRAYTQDRQGVVKGNLAHLDDGEGFEVAVSSPPYAQVDHKPTKLGEGKGTRATGESADRNKGDYHYPDSPGQLATLEEGQFRATVSSPPYEAGCRHTGGTDPHPEHIEGGDYHGLGIDIAISSPPFQGSVGSDDPDKRGGLYRDPKRREDVSLTGTYGETPGQLGGMEGDFEGSVGSPPYPVATEGAGINTPGNRPETMRGVLRDGTLSMGDTPGQLGTMSGGLKATISSPPFESSISRDTVDAETRVRLARERGVAAHDIRPIEVEKVGKREQEYGSTEGQLGTMEGGFEGSLTSPPYLPRSDRCIPAGGDHEALQRRDIEAGHSPISTFRTSYSDNPDNLGNPTGADQETFWGAARTIVEQVYQLLTPGGVAIWVTKDFIRKKARVPFTRQWAQLCVSVGFEWLHEHRCWMVEDNGTQLGLFGEEGNKDMIKKRLSFFRRLHIKKYPHLAIEHESVLCLRKPINRRQP